MRIFVPVANRFIRPRTNTDWRYAAKLLPKLSGYCPELAVFTQRNILADAVINFRYTLASIRGLPVLRHIPPRWTYSLEEDSPVFEADILQGKFNAVLAYERFPSRTCDLPVAWITSATDVDRQQEEGASREDAEHLKEWKWSRAEKAAKLIFTTHTSLNTFVQQSSESLRAKSVVIPFFLPGLTAVDSISDKWERDELRLVFVGRQAKRKGLVKTLDALKPLLEKDPRISLTIVSSLMDGPVNIPELPNIKVITEATREQVLDLLRDSHILVMPSSWESYGFVYIEAMSRGCIPLALDRPVQRELFGGHGILVPSQDPEQIRAAICKAIASRDELYEKAQSGLKDFRDRHSPEAVAENFRRVFAGITASKAAAE